MATSAVTQSAKPDEASVPSNAAAVQVFETPELCELILVHLDRKDLLLCQRTSPTFRNTIKGSITLRRKLWYQPDPSERTLTPGIYHYRPFTSINPFLLRYLTDVPFKTPPFMAVYPGKTNLNVDKIVVSFDVSLLDQPKGSWEEMLVAEGGDTEKDVPLACFLYDGCDYDRRVAMFDKTFKWGITAGQLVEEVRREYGGEKMGFVTVWDKRDEEESEGAESVN